MLFSAKNSDLLPPINFDLESLGWLLVVVQCDSTTYDISVRGGNVREVSVV